MKVSEKSGIEAPRYSKTASKNTSSDQFSRILKSKEEAARNGMNSRPPIAGNLAATSQDDLVPGLPLPATEVQRT
jgi:hypothetical protein